ncbi:MAG: hypothetical protein OCD01_12595 [Fibrobacterales bacterium]
MLKNIIYFTQCVLILAVVPLDVCAFESNLATLSYHWSPESSLKVAGDSTQLTSALGLQTVHAGFIIPYRLNKSFILMGAPQYKGLFVHGEFPERAQNTRSFHGFQMGLRAIWLKDSVWTGTISLLPKLITDFENGISNRIWQLNGAIAGLYRTHEYSLMLGLIYTRNTGRPLLLPLLGFQKRWSSIKFTTIMPSFMSLYYVFDNKLHMGVRTQLEGDHIRFNTETVSDIELRFSRISVGPDFLIPIKKPFFINIQMGYIFNVTDMEFSRNGTTVAKGELDSTPFIKAGIILKIPKIKKR